MSMVARIPREDEEEMVYALLQRVSASFSAVQKKERDFNELHETIMQLKEFIFSFDEENATAKRLMSGIQPKIVAGVNEAYSFWECNIETRFAQQFTKGQVSFKDYFLYGRIESLVRRELDLISLSPGKVLFAGSGALLLSPLLFHSQTGASVDCLPCDPAVVDVSRKVIEQCRCSDSVRVLDEQSTPDIRIYDLIVIDSLYGPKKALLKTARKRCRTDCRILCRTSYGLRQLLHPATVERDTRGFYIKAQQVAKGTQILSTWLLEAAGNAAEDIRLEWLRTIDPGTGKQILSLMNRTLEEETTIGFPGPIDDRTGQAVIRQLKEDVESEHRYVLVAYKSEDIVGQLILTPNSSPNHRHIVELTRGTIHPSFRGGGLALRAFREVAKKCEQLGREVICLDVRAGTNAAIWWQYFGFKQYGFLEDYSRVGNQRYQGLYLTQTTAELQRRLTAIAATKPGAAIGLNSPA